MEGCHDHDHEQENVYEALEQELQVILSLDHPNIIKMHQVVYDNNYINIVMELVQGKTLADLLARGNDDAKDFTPISEDLCKIIMYQCTVALIYLYSQKLAHRDIKLDNIMICGFDVKNHESNDLRNCKIKLIDFGLSKYK